jgi:hypothetical protein
MSTGSATTFGELARLERAEERQRATEAVQEFFRRGTPSSITEDNPAEAPTIKDALGGEKPRSSPRWSPSGANFDRSRHNRIAPRARDAPPPALTSSSAPCPPDAFEDSRGGACQRL